MKKRFLFLLIAGLFVGQTSVFALTQDDINSILGGTAYYDGGASECASNPIAGAENQQTVYNYFVSKGYSAEQASGIIGNMAIESGVDPLKWQGDRQDHQTPPNPDDPNEGWGLTQWTPANKVLNYASSVNKTPGDIMTQLDFLAAQLDGSYAPNNEKAAGDALKAVTATGPDGAVQAADVFETKFERPKDPSASQADREASAKAALAKYGGQVVGGPGVSCSCSPSGPSAQAANGQTTVVIDPGHVPGSTPSDERDPTTGLYLEDYDNPTTERVDAYNVSLKIIAKLKAAGYNAVDSKKSVDDKFNLGERAARDNAANPALIVVLHGDPGGAEELMYPDQHSNREPKGSPRTDGQNGLVDPSIETASETAAKTMAPIIASALGTNYQAKSFFEAYGQDGLGGNGLNSGNTPVQTILTKAPEVYSETALPNLGTDKFANAMVSAIEKAVPATGAPTGGGGGCAVPGNAVATAVNYAWADYKGSPFCDETTAYKQAINKAKDNGQYTGADCATDSSLHGIDCGGFVTRVMIDSGADPGYNDTGSLASGAGNTITQQAYLDAQVKAGKYQKLGSQTDTSKLQPGDIAINTDHTFIYVGQQSGFNGNIASASLGTRSPMAGGVIFSNGAGDFQWYRLVQ